MDRKHAIVILDGAADYPLPSLDGKTPLEAAKTPNLDRIVRLGMLGRVLNVPEGLQPGSDVAIMTLLGNDAKAHYSGRAPIEAVAKGITLGKGEWAFRCNFVTIENGVMKDYSAGGIANEEASELIEALNAEFGADGIRFHPGVSYRNLMVYKGEMEVTTTPPHDILDKDTAPYIPSGKGADLLTTLMKRSRPLLANHPVNLRRRQQGKNPANSIWFWGQGTSPDLPDFRKNRGMTGAVITAVDLVRGIGILMGFDCIQVPGATGFVNTNYKGKAEAAVKALKNHDLVCVHIEGPDESGHNGNPADKIEAIEKIDALIVGPLLSYLEEQTEGFRILALPDHPTPCALKTHTSDPVLFAAAGLGLKPNGFSAFTEKEAALSNLYITPGHTLMDFFLK
jgi:2,3-bisphosphoglycerate-independent phosphoglycerate mutase